MALSKAKRKQISDARANYNAAAMNDFNAAMGAIDFSDPANARAATKNVMRGLVIKHGDVMSRFAYEQYTFAQSGDFKPYVWRGLTDKQVEFMENMIDNVFDADRSAARRLGVDQQALTSSLRKVYEGRLNDVFKQTTLENGLEHQSVKDFINAGKKYKNDSSEKRAQRNRSRAREKVSWDGVYWAREINSDTPCDYCIMLASRGPEYLTKESAAAATAECHANCSCTIISSDEAPDGYEERLAKWQDWYANGVPEDLDAKRKSKWNENRNERRAEEKAAKEAANQSD